MNLEVILGIIFGGGAATLIATIYKVIDTHRKGRIESEDSVLTRLESENRQARLRADEAEKETSLYRQQMMQAEDLAALYRRMLIQHDIAVPRQEGAHHEK